ncbi:hypothetical protein BpHYR1_042004 [Brachionus plicatilis]|uniref:Uncharacterized protein n=1 Tax=Brachionus plicatilis TaxID=10195 RepID=A0A3M7RUJ6_BRAPC|nr:hypothetical protein BpHYR1_042004 [Brachionus plicatilis]
MRTALELLKQCSRNCLLCLETYLTHCENSRDPWEIQNYLKNFFSFLMRFKYLIKKCRSKNAVRRREKR